MPLQTIFVVQLFDRNTCIGACASANNWLEAIHLLDQMEREGPMPDVISYNTARGLTLFGHRNLGTIQLLQHDGWPIHKAPQFSCISFGGDWLSHLTCQLEVQIWGRDRLFMLADTRRLKWLPTCSAGCSFMAFCQM